MCVEMWKTIVDNLWMGRVLLVGCGVDNFWWGERGNDVGVMVWVM